MILQHACLGMGEVLCLTPVFRALRRKGTRFIALECKNHEGARELLWGNPNVDAVGPIGAFRGECVNVEDPQWDYEQAHRQNVSKSRPRIFLDHLRLQGDPVPEVWIKPQSRAWAKSVMADFDPSRPKLFYQTEAAEPYKLSSARTMLRVTDDLIARGYSVVSVTLSPSPLRSAAEHTLARVGLGIHDAMALFAECAVAVVYDSFYAQLGAALGKPCVGLLGMYDCPGRAVDYPYYLRLPPTIKGGCGCVPCWRNSLIPCERYKGPQAFAQSRCLDEIDCGALSKLLDRALSLGAGETSNGHRESE